MKIDEYGLRSEFNLEIYRPTINEALAMWTPEGNIKMMRNDLKIASASMVQDFTQTRKIFKVVTHIEEPYFMLKWVSNRSKFR